MKRPLTTFALAAAFLAATFSAPAAGAEETSDEIGPAVGTEAPDFTLRSLEGDEVSLSGLRGESPVVLVFFRGEW